MEAEREPLASIAFEAQVVEWRGPAPYFFIPVPGRHVDEIRWAARMASYGWGCVLVTARIGPTRFTTSLFPRNGTYMLPIKNNRAVGSTSFRRELATNGRWRRSVLFPMPAPGSPVPVHAAQRNTV